MLMIPDPVNAIRHDSCGNRHCATPDFTAVIQHAPAYCMPCTDLVDEHDEGVHDYESREYCPQCQS